LGRNVAPTEMGGAAVAASLQMSRLTGAEVCGARIGNMMK